MDQDDPRPLPLSPIRVNNPLHKRKGKGRPTDKSKRAKVGKPSKPKSKRSNKRKNDFRMRTIEEHTLSVQEDEDSELAVALPQATEDVPSTRAAGHTLALPSSCIVCGVPTGPAHKCPFCHGTIHLHCGTPVGEEGYGQKAICPNCAVLQFEANGRFR